MRVHLFIAVFGLILTLSWAKTYSWPTQITKPPKVDGSSFPFDLGPCSDIAPIKIISYKQKRISFHFCGEDWPSAQTLCIRRGGNLWEPSSDREFEFTFQAIGHVSGNQIPIWYHKFASWWIGSVKSPLYNDVQESSRSSNNGIWFPSTRKCVSIFGHNLTLTNQNCGFKLPFICEAKPYCSCKFGANEYHCNRQITILSECCRHVFCDSQGRIKLTTLYGYNKTGQLSKIC